MGLAMWPPQLWNWYWVLEYKFSSDWQYFLLTDGYRPGDQTLHISPSPSHDNYNYAGGLVPSCHQTPQLYWNNVCSDWERVECFVTNHNEQELLLPHHHWRKCDTHCHWRGSGCLSYHLMPDLQNDKVWRKIYIEAPCVDFIRNVKWRNLRFTTTV